MCKFIWPIKNTIHNFVSFQQMLKVAPLLLNTQFDPFANILAHLSNFSFGEICCEFIYSFFKFRNSFAIGFVNCLLCLWPKGVVEGIQIGALGRLLHVREPRYDSTSEFTLKVISICQSCMSRGSIYFKGKRFSLSVILRERSRQNLKMS